MFDPAYNIPESAIKINIGKKEVIIKKDFIRKLSELVLGNMDKKLIYRDWGRVSVFANNKDICRHSEISDILHYVNKYDNFYTLIDYVNTNENPIIKGMYIKSEIFKDKLFYVKIEKLKDFLVERGLEEYDEKTSKDIINYLDNCLISKKAGNF